ncbi:hypothetical protein P3L10_015859 [Capsicum annuum]
MLWCLKRRSSRCFISGRLSSMSLPLPLLCREETVSHRTSIGCCLVRRKIMLPIHQLHLSLTLMVKIMMLMLLRNMMLLVFRRTRRHWTIS